MQMNQISNTVCGQSLSGDIDWTQLDYFEELKNNITTIDELKQYLPRLFYFFRDPYISFRETKKIICHLRGMRNGRDSK